MSSAFRELSAATGTPESRRIAHERTLELLAAEIASLRLTDAEREAINVARIELYATHMFVCHHSHTLLKLLERTQ
jgi:hypothetical protein